MQPNPELVWIFSSGRSGTTWLMWLLSHGLDLPKWGEPRVGRMVAGFTRTEKWRSTRGDHLLSLPHRNVFVAGLRAFVQAAAKEKFGDERMVVVKEPNGSEGAPLLAEALPESRVILLMRDMRDALASSFDGKQPGHWQNKDGTKHAADVDPEKWTRKLTTNLMRDMNGAVKAYDAHTGPRSLVYYEDLVADTLGTLSKLLTDLDIPFSTERVEAAVKRLAFDAIAEEERGAGKFYRKGAAGGWREDLTGEQIAVVEEMAEPLLSRFYPESAVTSGA